MFNFLQLIIKESGVAWNKRYKKKYGSIGKVSVDFTLNFFIDLLRAMESTIFYLLQFLMDHPNLYLYEEPSRQVMLLSNLDEETTSAEASDIPDSTTADSPVKEHTSDR